MAIPPILIGGIAKATREFFMFMMRCHKRFYDIACAILTKP
jgi:hypothetical protein